jgi:non-specific serine/threonine protein kinase
VRLFVERAQAIVPDFHLTPANATAVADVCVRLDGIPLALELAAARVRVLTVEQIRARLDDAFRLLTGGIRAAPTRQQTLRATLDWSYDLLTEFERALFQRIAVFAGSFDIEAVESVCEGVEALDLVTRLVDKSLLIVEADGEVARYRLLEPVRQYADHHLAADGAREAARARHIACYLALAVRAAPELHGPDQMAWMARLRRDQDNLRAALRWADERGDVETVARLAVALVPFWAVHGTMSEGRRWLEAALAGDHPRPLSPALRVTAFLGAGQLAYWQLDLEQAVVRFEAGLALARGLGDERAIANALTGLGTVRGRQMAFEEATHLLRESLSMHQALGNETGAAWALFHLGMAAGNQDDWRSSIELLEESLERYRALGNGRFAAMTCMNLGAALTGLGNFERATGLIREGLTGLQAVGERAFMLSGLLTLAWVAACAKQPDRAARLLGAGAALRTTTGAILGPVNRRTHDMVFDMIRPRLGQTALDDALARGRTMSLDEAIEEAMQLGQPERRVRVAPVPLPGGPVEALTRREREIIPLLAQGASDREIAAELTIAMSTVGVHVHHILGKLGLNSRWQAADWAAANGLSPAPSD